MKTLNQNGIRSNRMNINDQIYTQEKFISLLIKYIKEYHKMFPLLPLRAEYWESRLNDVLNDCDYETDWAPGSHKVGADIELYNDGYTIRISVKGGSLQNKTSADPAIQISSCRTTSFKTIEEKKQYLGDGKDHEDVVISLAYVKPLKKDSFTHKYIYSIFETPNFKEMNWAIKNMTKKGPNYHVENSEYSPLISSSQSDQLWYKMPFSKMLYQKEIILD